MAYAVAAGEMFDAVNFFGPFQEFDDAQEWADDAIGTSLSWWIVKLEPTRQDGLATLVIDGVDMDMLQKQYEALQQLPEGVLDGLTSMVGDLLPLPTTDES